MIRILSSGRRGAMWSPAGHGDMTNGNHKIAVDARIIRSQTRPSATLRCGRRLRRLLPLEGKLPPNRRQRPSSEPATSMQLIFAAVVGWCVQPVAAGEKVPGNSLMRELSTTHLFNDIAWACRKPISALGLTLGRHSDVKTRLVKRKFLARPHLPKLGATRGDVRLGNLVEPLPISDCLKLGEL